MPRAPSTFTRGTVVLVVAGHLGIPGGTVVLVVAGHLGTSGLRSAGVLEGVVSKAGRALGRATLHGGGPSEGGAPQIVYQNEYLVEQMKADTPLQPNIEELRSPTLVKKSSK